MSKTNQVLELRQQEKVLTKIVQTGTLLSLFALVLAGVTPLKATLYRSPSDSPQELLIPQECEEEMNSAMSSDTTLFSKEIPSKDFLPIPRRR